MDRVKFLEDKFTSSGYLNNPVISNEELFELDDLYQKMYNKSECKYFRSGVSSYQNLVRSCLRARRAAITHENP
jgi:hypothetical protein